MKVKFISTTNELAQCIVGRECNLSYDLTAHFIYNSDGLEFDYRKGVWRTSIIKTVNIEEISRFCYDITIKTSTGSEYVFREGEKSDKAPLTEEEKATLLLSMGVF